MEIGIGSTEERNTGGVSVYEADDQKDRRTHAIGLGLLREHGNKFFFSCKRRHMRFATVSRALRDVYTTAHTHTTHTHARARALATTLWCNTSLIYISDARGE